MSDDTMDARKAYVDQLHDSISQDGYDVDPEAVAEAIIRRLLAGSMGRARPERD